MFGELISRPYGDGRVAGRVRVAGADAVALGACTQDQHATRRMVKKSLIVEKPTAYFSEFADHPQVSVFVE
jgi:hypothetical protein